MRLKKNVESLQELTKEEGKNSETNEGKGAELEQPQQPLAGRCWSSCKSEIPLGPPTYENDIGTTEEEDAVTNGWCCGNFPSSSCQPLL